MKKNLLNALVVFLAGCSYALSYPSFLGDGVFVLLFPGLIAFLWKLNTASFRASLALIFFYNLGLNVTGYYWIPHTLREFGQLSYPVSILVGAVFGIILQPHWWVYAVWKKFFPQLDSSRTSFLMLNSLILTLMERFVPQQFPSYVGSPWLHLAPYLGLAPYFGVAVFSFITYWLSFEIIEQLQSKKLKPYVGVIFFLFFGINTLLPLKNSENERSLRVRIVQANIGNFLKISSEQGEAESLRSIISDYQKLSLQETGDRPELIIWPETAYPHSFYGLNSQLDEVFINIMKATGSELLIGGYDSGSSINSMDFFESVYNSSILMRGDKVQSVYHKNILIPFGETLPFGALNRQIVSLIPSISLFAQGKGTPVMETKSGLRFVTPICYEILESDYMRDMLNQWNSNHFIVNHTNDSWYGRTAEPEQHLFLSKWRALEFQLPIIRSTNTGITSVIYPDGSESRRLGIGDKGALDVDLSLATPSPTFYQQWGIYPLIILLGVVIILLRWFERNGSRP
jgi:apolipoprotein N-acyltransferase